MSAVPHVSLELARMTNAPYAGPSARAGTSSKSSGDASPPRDRPYVPLAWRGTGLVAHDGGATHGASSDGFAAEPDALPPIAEFLADDAMPWSNAAPQLNASAPVDEAQSAGDRASGREWTGVKDNAASGGDDWPFADAGAETVELSGEIRAPDETQSSSREHSDSSSHATSQSMSHAMWSDDDLVDIMPSSVQQSPSETTWGPGARDATPGDAISTDPGTDTAHQRIVGSRENSESAARALESLAQRVRSGELALPGYVPELGDAAALAAALAALLGIRRG